MSTEHLYNDVNIDKFVFHDVSVGCLEFLLGRVCDLANKNPYSRERRFLDQLCVVSSPPALFIPEHSRGVFLRKLANYGQSVHRFVSPSQQPGRLLEGPKPMKIVTQEGQHMLHQAGIFQVDVLCYGTKSHSFNAHFLEDILRATPVAPVEGARLPSRTVRGLRLYPPQG